MKAGEAIPDGRRTKVRNAFNYRSMHPLSPPTLNVEASGGTPKISSCRRGNIDHRGVKGIARGVV